jgi:hypothetical protein
MRPVLGGTSIWIRFRHFNHMFLGTVGADVLQMTVIEIINVIAMSNGRMATARSMDVRTCAGGLIAGWHWRFLSSRLRRDMVTSLHLNKLESRQRRAVGAIASD